MSLHLTKKELVYKDMVPTMGGRGAASAGSSRKLLKSMSQY